MLFDNKTKPVTFRYENTSIDLVYDRKAAKALASLLGGSDGLDFLLREGKSEDLFMDNAILAGVNSAGRKRFIDPMKIEKAVASMSDKEYRTLCAEICYALVRLRRGADQELYIMILEERFADLEDVTGPLDADGSKTSKKTQ